MARALQAITLLLLLMVGPASAQNVIDSLLRVLPSKSGEERVRALGDVQWELGFGDPQHALAYGQEAMKVAEGMRDSAVIAIAANDLAITEHRLGHFQRALELNRRALRIREAARDTMGIAASHSKLASAFTELSAFDSALSHNYLAARIYEQRGDLLRAAQTRGNVARLYEHLGDLDRAVKVSRETNEMLKATDSDYAKANAMGQLAQILESRKEFNEALVEADKAMRLYEQMGSKGDIASLSNIIGLIHRERGDDEKGLLYYRQALRMATEVNDLIGEATFSNNVAHVLVEKNELPEAGALYEQALGISRREGYVDQEIAALGGLVNVLEHNGDAEGALDRQREMMALKDSLFEAKRVENLSEMQVKYETERTEKELAQSREHELAQQAEIQRRRILQGVLVGGLLLLALSAFLFISRQRARHKARLNAELVAERDRGLKAVLDNTDAERKRIAGELHDGVGQQLTGLKFRLEDIASRVAKKHPEEGAHMKEILSIADDASRDVRGIAHQMMPRSLGDLGLAPALNDMLHKSLARPGVHHTFEHFGLEARLPPDVEVGVYRIAQELVGNIMKHADARNVSVQLLKNKGHLVLIVEDDGRGIDPAKRSQGMGMRSISDRARVLHGTIEMESSENKGTVATLRVPLTNGQRT